MSTRPLSRSWPLWRPSLEVQPEHHNISSNCDQNAIRQWQWQSWHADNNTAIAKWDHGSASNIPSSMLTRSLLTSLSPWCPSLQVQPEHHSSGKNYNRNAIRQWRWQWKLVTRKQHSSGTWTRTGNSPLASLTTLTRPLSRSWPPWHPSLQVQPEHQNSSNNYNRNAIRQWWQRKLWHADNNTAAKREPAMGLQISKQPPFINMDVRANEEMGRYAGDAERGRTHGWWRQGMVMGLPMVLIEDVLTLLLMLFTGQQEIRPAYQTPETMQ